MYGFICSTTCILSWLFSVIYNLNTPAWQLADTGSAVRLSPFLTLYPSELALPTINLNLIFSTPCLQNVLLHHYQPPFLGLPPTVPSEYSVSVISPVELSWTLSPDTAPALLYLHKLSEGTRNRSLGTLFLPRSLVIPFIFITAVTNHYKPGFFKGIRSIIYKYLEVKCLV